MRGQRPRIKGFDAQAKVIHIAPLRARRGAALAADFTIHRHQIDQRIAGAQLRQAEILALFSSVQPSTSQ